VGDKRKQPDGGMGRRETDTVKLAEADLRAVAQYNKAIQRFTGLGWAFIGLLTLFAAVSFFFGDPSNASAISKQLNDTGEAVWNTGWGIGGVAILFGVVRPNITIELIGQFLLSAALTTYSVAVIEISGNVPAVSLSVALLFFGALRTFFLIHYAPRLTYILSPKEEKDRT
jgi:hypothetical protein